jgi:DNA-binding transcriptional LysR family regulator
LVAYDEDLPLVREHLAAVFGAAPELSAAVTVPDLRVVARLVAAGAGWSVLPDYICTEAIADGSLVNIAGLREAPENALYLVWTKAALRHPRVTFVRDRLSGFL